MTALLVLFTFVLFAGLDYVSVPAQGAAHRRRALAPAPAPASPRRRRSRSSSRATSSPRTCTTTSGTRGPAPIGPDMAVVGIDDFASKLTGRAKP